VQINSGFKSWLWWLVHIAYLSLIIILFFIPDDGPAATVARVALFGVVFLIIYKSKIPEDRGIQQLINSRGVKRFLVVRYWVMKIFWRLYKGFAYLALFILISQEFSPGK